MRCSGRTSAVRVLAIVAATLCAACAAFGSGFWQWTDDAGRTHVADALEKVPVKYRDKAKAPDVARPRPAAPVVNAAAAQGATAAAAAPAPANTAGRIEVPFEELNQKVVIQVSLNGGDAVPMAIDTGSPGLVLTFDLAEKLGMFSRDQGALLVGVGGVGGSDVAVLGIVDSVAIKGASDSFVPAKVMRRMSTDYEGFLGYDFMANYTLSIDTGRHVVVFQPNTPDADAHAGHGEAWWRRTFREFRVARDEWERRSKSPNLLPGVKPLFEFQAYQSERLYQRLEQYASESGVPRHWR